MSGSGLTRDVYVPILGLLMTDLSQRLDAARKEAGMPIADLAAAAGTSARHMRRYLAGTSTPPVDVARRIADALGCSLDEITSNGAPA